MKEEKERKKASVRRQIILASCVTLMLACLSVAFVLTFTVASKNYGDVTKERRTQINYDDLKMAIAKSFECHKNPGMVVSIVKDGKTVLSKGYGVTLPGNGEKVTTDTQFLIASLTKAFSAALLVDVLANNTRNKSYALNQPLRDILGADIAFADEERTKYATTEDLLSHRIGLPNKMFMRFNPSINRTDFIKLARYWKSKVQFRATAKYSSTAYTLVAAITELIGGMSWEDLVTERILQPLDMNSTGFAFTTNFSHRNVAKPYDIYDEREAPIDPLFTRVWNSRCGSGCIMSTGNDMAKWMNFILLDGMAPGTTRGFPAKQTHTLTKVRSYLPSSTRDIITKPTFPVTSVADEYGLGWRNGIYKGYKILSHSGSSPGFASFIMLHPDSNLGIFIAMNGNDNGLHYRLALSHYIFDTLLGEQPWLNTTTLCTFPAPWQPHKPRRPVKQPDAPTPILPLEDYLGAYNSDIYGEAFVNYNSSTKSLQAFYGVGSWQLVPQTSTNLFNGKGIWVTDFWDMQGFQFVPAADDPTNITQLVIEGFDRSDPPVFYREFN